MMGVLPDVLRTGDDGGDGGAGKRGRAFSGSGADGGAGSSSRCLDGGAGSSSLCLFVVLLAFKLSAFNSRLERDKQGD